MISFSSPGSLYSCSWRWFYQASVGTENLGTDERETSLYFTDLTKMNMLVINWWNVQIGVSWWNLQDGGN